MTWSWKSCFHMKVHGYSLSRSGGVFWNFLEAKFRWNSKRNQATSASTAPFDDCLKGYLWKTRNNGAHLTRWKVFSIFLDILLGENFKRPQFLNGKTKCFMLGLTNGAAVLACFFFEFSRNFTSSKFQKTFCDKLTESFHIWKRLFF